MAIKEKIRNKKYEITVRIGDKPDGTRLNHYETFYGLKSEAKIRENEIKASIKNNTYIRNSRLTIKDLFIE